MGAPHCIHYLLICIDLWSLEFDCFFHQHIFQDVFHQMCSTLPPNLPPCRISCPRATSMTGAPGISGPLLLVRSPAKPWNPQTNWKTSGAMEHSYTFFLRIYTNLNLMIMSLNTGNVPENGFQPLVPSQCGIQAPFVWAIPSVYFWLSIIQDGIVMYCLSLGQWILSSALAIGTQPSNQ